METAAPAAARRRFALPPAFQYPAYRAYWLGLLASVTGFNLRDFAVLWLTHELTDSPVILGAVGAATALPAILLAPVGGSVADRKDRRKLVVVAQLLLAVIAVLLAFLDLFEVVRPWQILALAALAGGIFAFDQPARQAFYPHLVERRALLSAVAMNISVWQATRIAAPALAGVLIALTSTSVVLFMAAGSFFLMAGIMLTLPKHQTEAGPGESSSRQMMEGFRFIRKDPVFKFLVGMSVFVSLFGMGYLLMMPVFADNILHVGPQGQGVLLGASGVGSLMATLALGVARGGQRRGPLIVGGAAFSGLAVAAFALTAGYIGSYPLAIVLMFLAGLFMSAYMVSVMGSIQAMVPDYLRGRVMGLVGATWSFMLLGGLLAGVAAHFIGAPWAVAAGGLAVTAFALGPALLNPGIRGLGAAISEAAVAQEGRSIAEK
ncbi:MAG: MFS transporter [SAR202 cluster bacterium]|nr:MFS transporter [SAR202 cluster bacterium]